MAYIEAHQSLRDHRKILALAAELDMPEPHVAGHCLYLWLWSLDNAPDGALPRSERIIERAASWVGASGAFVAAMVTVGMLERESDGALFIHDWYDYAGRLIEKRRENADRMRAARAKNMPKSATHVQRTFTARAGATVPNRTVSNSKGIDTFSPNTIVGADALVLVAANAADEDGFAVMDSDIAPGSSLPAPQASTPPRRTPPTPIPLDGEATRVAAALRDAILSHKPDAKDARAAKQASRLQNWARPIDCMMRLDERSVERMLAVITWLPTNEFWRRNILSPSKFREKFDTLELLYRSERQSSEGGGSHGRNGHANGHRNSAPGGAREVVTDQEVWRQRAAAHRANSSAGSTG